MRSILAKLPHIRADNSLRSASVLCFCETWLNASQPHPVLLDDKFDIRCDRLTCDNKGGVLLCVPRQMNPSNEHRFATNGIEAVSATLQVPNRDSMQIAVVYRSPSVPQAVLIPILSRLLTHLSLCNTPCVVVGDFNEDILQQTNSAVLKLMSIFSYRELVQVPTTPKGTLIDHTTYYKNHNSHDIYTVANIKDTYYLDHDTVYCSISF